MAEIDGSTFGERAVLLGLIAQDQLYEAMTEAEDGSVEALEKGLLRKGSLTSWQADRLKKGRADGFFYGGCKVMFHIAEGTFARVYRGRRQPGNQSVAIKVLRQRFTGDAMAVHRFAQEAESGIRLVHPNIVRIFDYGEQDRQHFMIMEFVEGSNLRDFLRIRGRLRPHEAFPLMLGLARGLAYSIAEGVTHRDIKATNILVSSTGVAKLVDYGLATLRTDEKSVTNAHGQRTVDYSALERTCGSPKGDPRSDIYFLGCVFYYMVTGVVPMPETESKDMLAKMLKRSFSAIKPLGDHPNPPPEQMVAIVERMMKIDLKQRYQRVEDIIADLEAYQAKDADRRRSEAEVKAARTLEAASPTKRPDIALGEPEVPSPFEGPISPPPSILFVEAQPEAQDIFRKAFARLGYRPLLVGDAERAAQRFREKPPEAVVFDADGLGPEAFDAFLDMHEKAHEDGHELAALVIVGPKQLDLLERLPADDRLVVLTKPVKMKEIQDAVAQLVPLPSGARG